ncbi:type II toxin-antitoxin system HicB family antitoxin, partial [candidate division WOR-3 bacterium]|nr:type II toxin-antitoxin system HicB family antitoxin [candidate division WOR-3 bacterium]
MKNKKSRGELLQYYMGLPYTIKITPEEVGGYFVEIEEFEGCMSQGETIEEVMKNIKEAQEGWLEVAIEEGLEIPLP